MTAGADRSAPSPAQIRAARALLGWKQSDLAARSNVSEISIKNIERGAQQPRLRTALAIEQAFHEAGVVFLGADEMTTGGAGLRFRANEAA